MTLDPTLIMQGVLALSVVIIGGAVLVGKFHGGLVTCYACNEDGHEADECPSLSPCCGLPFDEDERICPRCRDHV